MTESAAPPLRGSDLYECAQLVDQVRAQTATAQTTTAPLISCG